MKHRIVDITIAFLASFGISVLLQYTVQAGFIYYDAEVKLSKDHKAGETVKCSSLTTSFFDKKKISCEEPK